MINAVGREIPEEILKLTGKEVFRETIILTEGNSGYTGRKQPV